MLAVVTVGAYCVGMTNTRTAIFLLPGGAVRLGPAPTVYRPLTDAQRRQAHAQRVAR